MLVISELFFADVYQPYAISILEIFKGSREHCVAVPEAQRGLWGATWLACVGGEVKERSQCLPGCC